MNLNARAVVGLLLLLAFAGLGGKFTSVPIASTLLAQSESEKVAKRILGPVATIGEGETDIQFLARVDTGATTCSLHAAEKRVIDGSKYMEDNLGKTIRFRIENRTGESKWLRRTIVEIRKIRTSEGEETRYLVPMTLLCNDVQREVLVSLNDRSRMSYAMLLGRNFLAGEFVVDVTDAEKSLDLLASEL